jgi:hypothetical protein
MRFENEGRRFLNIDDWLVQAGIPLVGAHLAAARSFHEFDNRRMLDIKAVLASEQLCDSPIGNRRPFSSQAEDLFLVGKQA